MQHISILAKETWKKEEFSENIGVMKNLFAAGLLFSLCTACTTVTEKLAPEANNVVVLKDVTITELDRLKKIGSGSCEIGMNARLAQTNSDSCKNYLRNEAAKKGSDYIVYVSDVKDGYTKATVSANFYQKR